MVATVTVVGLAPLGAAQAHESPGAFSGGEASFASGVTQTWSTTGLTSITQAGALSAKGYTTDIYSPKLSGATPVTVMNTAVGSCSSTGACSGLGTIKVQFSQPVLDPVIHLAGLGGNSAAIFHGTFTLVTPNLTLAKVGNGTNLTVNGSLITATNHSTGTTCTASPTPAACGSVQIKGLVTEAVFNVGAHTMGGLTSGNDEYTITATIDQDFGDAPASYDAGGAARHAVGGLKLGATITADATAIENATVSPYVGATVDGDFDDGIGALPNLSTLVTTHSATVALSGVTKAARVCGWVDFNGDGSFSAGERACATVAAGATSATLNWTGLTGLVAGDVHARFRVGYTTAQVESPTGAADSGEVEDHKIKLFTPAAPAAVDDTATTVQNVPVTVNPLTNDTHSLPLDPATVFIQHGTSGFVRTLTVAGKGTYLVNETTGIITFTPAHNFTGTVDAITYRVADTAGRTTTATITTTVSAVTPVAVNDTDTTPYNTTVITDVMANDYAGHASAPIDAGINKIGSSATSINTWQLEVPGEGVFNLGINHPDYDHIPLESIEFIPAPGFVGTTTPIYYEIQDANGTKAVATYTVTVSLPAAPAATADTATTAQNVPVTISPLGNDSAATGVALRADSVLLVDAADSNALKPSVTVAGQGTYAVNTSTGQVVFTPIATFTGVATPVGYRVTDTTGQHASATITPTVTAVTPTADDETVTAVFNTPLVIDVLDGDLAGSTTTSLVASTVRLLDAAGNGQTSVTVTNKGTFSVDTTTGLVTFTPVTGYQGPVPAVDYEVRDTNGTRATATITVTVAAPAPPVAVDNDATTLQGKPVTLPVLGNDGPGTSGAALDATSVKLYDTTDSSWKSSVTVSGQGTWTADAVTGAVTFTPLPAYHGTATPVTYQVADTNGATAQAALRVTVTQVTPTAATDSTSTAYKTAVTLALLTNDAPGNVAVPLDPTSVYLLDSTNTPVRSLTIANEGTYAVNALTGVLTFTPVALFTGAGSTLTYEVRDVNGTRATSTVEVTVDMPPLPTALPDPVTTKQDINVLVWPLTNDSAGTDSSLTASSVRLFDTVSSTYVTTVTIADEGTYTVDTANGSVLFDPLPTFTGTSTVSYRVLDEVGQPAISTITATVTPITPTALDNPVTTPFAHAVVVPVLANDAAGDPTAPLVASSVQIKNPSGAWVKTFTVTGQGTYEVQLDGTVRFTPASGFAGALTPVEYRVADDNGTFAVASLTVTVGQPPVAADDVASTRQNTPVTAIVLTNDLAGTGATLTPASVLLFDPSDSLYKSSVTISGKGVFTADPLTGAVHFVPVASFSGTGVIEYKVTDSDNNSTVANLTVTVTAVTPVAAADSASTPFRTPVTLTPLGNDTAGHVSAPLTAGSVQLYLPTSPPQTPVWASSVTIPGQGTFTVLAGGAVEFVPEPGHQGPVDVVSYRVSDSNGTYAASTLTVMVGSAPVAAPDKSTVLQGQPATLNPLSNDTPGTGGTLTPSTLTLIDPVTSTPVSTLVVPGEGTWTVTSTGTATFEPLPGFFGTTTPVDYRVTDSHTNTATSTMSVVVQKVTPVAVDDAVQTKFGVPVTVTVLGNDTAGDPAVALVPGSVQLQDPEDGLYKTKVVVDKVGTYEVQADGTVTFTPAAHFSGTAPGLGYRVADVNGTTATAVLVVRVDAALGALGRPDSKPTPATGSITLDPLTNDTPSQGATFVRSTLCLVTPTGGCVKQLTVAGVGTWVVSPAGMVTFTPVKGYSGPATVAYRVVDTNGITLSARISLAVKAPLPGKLPHTGTEAMSTGVFGLLLLVAGAGAIAVSRRRPERD